jgi:hypothetical protein
MEVNGEIHAPAAAPQGKSPWCPLCRRLSEHQSQSGRGGEERNSQPLLGLETLFIQPVAQRYTTELSRLLERLKAAKRHELNDADIKLTEVKGVRTFCTSEQ